MASRAWMFDAVNDSATGRHRSMMVTTDGEIEEVARKLGYGESPCGGSKGS